MPLSALTPAPARMKTRSVEETRSMDNDYMIRGKLTEEELVAVDLRLAVPKPFFYWASIDRVPSAG